MSVPKVQAQTQVTSTSTEPSTASSTEERTQSAFVSTLSCLYKTICCNSCCTARKKTSEKPLIEVALIDSFHQEGGNESSHELPAAKQFSRHDQITPLRLQPLSLQSPEDGEDALPFAEDYTLIREGTFRIPISDFESMITVSEAVISMLPVWTRKRPSPPLPHPFNTYIGSNRTQAQQMIRIAQIENESYRFTTALSYMRSALAIFREELDGVSSSKKKECTSNIEMLEGCLNDWDMISREEAPSSPKEPSLQVEAV